MKKINNIFLFLIITALSVLMFSLRSAEYPQWIISFCGLLSEYLLGFVNSVSFLKNIIHAYTVYGTLAKVLVLFVCASIGFAIAKERTEKTAEKSAAVYCNIDRVIKYGVVFIALHILMMFVLLHSVIGIMAVVLNIAVMTVTAAVGMFYFSVVLGSYLQRLYNGNARSVATNYLLGVLAVSLCCNIYGFAEIMIFFVCPVLGCGSFIVAAYSSITNMHFDTSLVGFEKEHFDINKIRDIITRGID